MPEYSTPKLTPAETTQLPGMNNNNSGYVTVKEVLDIIRNTIGQANGIASLNASGKLSSSQVPEDLDDVLVYGSSALLPAAGEGGKLYITADDNKGYRWASELETPAYVLLFDPEVGSDLSTLITNLTTGVLIVKKAYQDEDSRNIKATYATKTELQEHIDAFNALGLSVVDGAINITFTE